MSILITGGTGFIGRSVVEKFVQNGYNIICTIRNRDDIEFFETKNVKIIFIENYYKDELKKSFKEEEIDGIIHIASYTQRGSHNFDDIENLIDSNIKFGAYLLDLAVKSNVKWFINTGTFWQYSNCDSYSPFNLYAATKEAFLNLARYFYSNSSLKFVSLVLFDSYGKNDKRRKIFNIWNDLPEDMGALDMTPGNQFIDISHVDDISNAFYILSLNLNYSRGIINSGDTFSVMAESRYTLKELSVIFEKASNKKLNINWGGINYRENEIMEPIRTIKTVPGWKPLISILDGIKEIVDSE